LLQLCVGVYTLKQHKAEEKESGVINVIIWWCNRKR